LGGGTGSGGTTTRGGWDAVAVVGARTVAACGFDAAGVLGGGNPIGSVFGASTRDAGATGAGDAIGSVRGAGSLACAPPELLPGTEIGASFGAFATM
jgi:hypothetical protein